MLITNYICINFRDKAKAQKQRPLGLGVFAKAVEILRERFIKKEHGKELELQEKRKGAPGGDEDHGNESQNQNTMAGEADGKTLVYESFGRVKVCFCLSVGHLFLIRVLTNNRKLHLLKRNVFVFLNFIKFEEILCSKIVAAIRKNGLATDEGWSAFVDAFSSTSSSASPGIGMAIAVANDKNELLKHRHIDGRFYERKCLEIVATRVSYWFCFIYLLNFVSISNKCS